MYFSKLAPYLLAAAGHVALSTQQYRQPCTAVAVVDNDNNQLLVDVWTIGVLVNSVTVPYSGDFDTLPATVMDGPYVTSVGMAYGLESFYYPPSTGSAQVEFKYADWSGTTPLSETGGGFWSTGGISFDCNYGAGP